MCYALLTPTEGLPLSVLGTEEEQIGKGSRWAGRRESEERREEKMWLMRKINEKKLINKKNADSLKNKK